MVRRRKRRWPKSFAKPLAPPLPFCKECHWQHDPKGKCHDPANFIVYDDIKVRGGK